MARACRDDSDRRVVIYPSRGYRCYCRDGARIVGVTEGVLRETEEALDRAKEFMPQFEIDGLRNIWIVKPGNKSKGIGETHYLDWILASGLAAVSV